MNPIVGIGEVLWDVYPDGRKVAGGAPFNFAFHCHQLGHPAVIVSRVGDDELGRELRARVRELGLSDEYIQTDREHPTGTVQVTLDANAVPTYTITENVAWDWIEWDEKLESLAKTCRAVCFGSLSTRHERSCATILQVADIAGDLGSLVVWDVNIRTPAPTQARICKWFMSGWWEWFKASAEDLAFLLAMFPGGLWPEPGRLPIPTRLYTFGADGCEITTPSGEVLREPGVSARVVDTVGAGDAFTAAMVCLHLEGRPLRDCARFANHYAARVCEQPGGTPRIDRREVELSAFGR
jgi:fructokinase